jgi:hypothetical protein
VRRAFAVSALALLLLSACGGTDRPEGVVERWLVTLNQGKAGEPEKYAPERLSREILPHWESRDPGDLDVIEVGKGRTLSHGFGIAEGQVVSAVLVPYRVKRSSGVSIDGEAVVGRIRGDWRIVATGTRESNLLVPSEGGERIGSAGIGAWGVALGISAALMLLVALVMVLTPKPAPLPVRRNT